MKKELIQIFLGVERMKRINQGILFFEKDDVDKGCYEIVMDLCEGGTVTTLEESSIINRLFEGDINEFLNRTIAPIPSNRYKAVRVYHSEHIYR